MHQMFASTQSHAMAPSMLARPAFLLGYAGLFPPLAAAIAAFVAPPEWRELAYRSGALYAGLILSFLGGAWWGLATRAGRGRALPLYVIAVMPTLVALTLLMVLTPPRLLILAGAIALTLPVDQLLTRMQLAPANWMRLRVPLTVGLSVLTAALAVAAIR
jgi:hypothetical protein